MTKLNNLHRRHSLPDLASHSSQSSSAASAGAQRAASSQDVAGHFAGSTLRSASVPPPMLQEARPPARRARAVTPPGPPPADAQVLARHRAERLVDQLDFRQNLAEVLADPSLHRQRLQIIEFLADLPKHEMKRLCLDTVAWAGPEASPVPHCATLLALLLGRQAMAAGPAAPITNVLPVLLAEEARLKAAGVEHPQLDLLQFFGLQQPSQHALVPLIQQLLVARIDPPAAHRQRWFDADAEDFKMLIHPDLPELYPRLFAETKRLLGADDSLWGMGHWAIALLDLNDEKDWDGHTPLPQDHALCALARSLRQQHAADDAALYGHLLAGVDADLRTLSWEHVSALHQQLPLCTRAQLLDTCAGFGPKALADFGNYARKLVPAWAPGDEAQLLLDVLAKNLHVLNDTIVQVYAGYSRPELPLQGRKELLESVLLWHGEAGFAPGFTQAQTFIDHARVPAALVAEVLRALRFVEARNPNMRPALTALLASTLDDGSKQACIRILMQVEDALRPQVLPMVLAKRAPGNVRAEDPESAMHSGRIRASDLVVAQVVDRVPRTSNWRSTLSQVAAYISAAKIDPQTDPLLLSSSRTGVSELDNALYTLQGPTQEGDANDALVHNPVYALTVQKRVVGLGHLAASLWQLLRDSPADAPSLQQQRQERQHARVNFILALARSVEISGRRVCGWGLSEQLTEVCAGYIKGIEQAPMIYPPQLLSQLAQNFAKSDVADDRMEQERFFHNAIAQAEHILFSPEAAEDFAAQLLEHMRQDYGWPKA